MEIRLTPRRSGISTWLLSEAVGHAKEFPGSACYMVYPMYPLLDSSWHYKSMELAQDGFSICNEKMFAELSNRSVIEFVTLDDMISGKIYTHRKRNFMFIDNMEMIYQLRWLRGSNGMYAFLMMEDVYIGGTYRTDGEFMMKLDYREFLKEHDMTDYIIEIDRIHDFIIETDHLRNKGVMKIHSSDECEFCKECDRRNCDCLRLGEFLAVRRECPMYTEMMMRMLNCNGECILSGEQEK